MRNKTIELTLTLVLLLAGLMALSAQAGEVARGIIDFTGDCNSATVEYEFFAETVDITFTTSTGQTITFNGKSSFGSVKATFFPPLPNGTTVTVEIDFGRGTATDTITVGCSNSSGGTIFIQICDDGRANINLCEPVAVYPVESDDGIGLIIYSTARNDIGRFLLYIAAEELDALPEDPSGICTIAQSDDGFATVYLLESGTLMVYAGPDDEGKVFIFFFETFPSQPRYETFPGGAAAPDFPSCF